MLNTLSSRLHASMEKDDDCERAKIVELRQTAFEHLEAGEDYWFFSENENENELRR